MFIEIPDRSVRQCNKTKHPRWAFLLIIIQARFGISFQSERIKSNNPQHFDREANGQKQLCFSLTENARAHESQDSAGSGEEQGNAAHLDTHTHTPQSWCSGNCITSLRSYITHTYTHMDVPAIPAAAVPANELVKAGTVLYSCDAEQDKC